MKEIVLNIEKNGKVTVDPQGYVGGECVDATKAIEGALGKTMETTKKPEFHQLGELEVIEEQVFET